MKGLLYLCVDLQSGFFELVTAEVPGGEGNVTGRHRQEIL